ncbi:unnamed protein product [Ostreobium quekettii]|uniref:F-box domain-containing protein n=1 Tax=Ostreobium quekettii TaxID=121088 RepID=A0A8S1J1K3_9CHLO|nr:unnamed protein product [Ostreobium quekettii]|eukprot:evm.model.scf_750.6 EVM.evm.TU.scf_750.6   scf_750:45275-47369(-)
MASTAVAAPLGAGPSAGPDVHVVAHYLHANRPWLRLYGHRLRSAVAPAELAPIQRAVPDELMIMIFGWLSPFALGRAGCACRQWRILVEHPGLWRRACLDAFRPQSHAEGGDAVEVLRACYGGSWKRMFLEREHLRFDGVRTRRRDGRKPVSAAFAFTGMAVYCSRNTYVRTGCPEWRERRSGPPVYLVVYFRYIRFLSDGTMYYRTTPEIPVKAVRRLLKPLESAWRGQQASRPDVLKGKYRISGGVASCVAVYPNSGSTELRLKLRIRSTHRGAHNRLDPLSIVTTDRDGRLEEDDAEVDPEEGEEAAGMRREHKRGMSSFVFIPWESVESSPFNAAADSVDFFLCG